MLRLKISKILTDYQLTLL